MDAIDQYIGGIEHAIYTYFIHDFLQKESKSVIKILNFQNLSKICLQRMVCHESYKDEKGNWLSDEVEKIDAKTFVKKIDKSKVNVGPPSRCLNPRKIQLILKL